MRTVTAYAALPDAVPTSHSQRTRFTPLHATAASAARATPSTVTIARITYRVPEHATFKAFAVDGRLLGKGDDEAVVLESANERDTIGAGALIAVQLPDLPAEASRLRLALHHAVFGNLDETKSMADYIVAVDSTDGRPLAA